MSKPTAAQVEAERKALKHLKRLIPTLDRYRVNRHDAIDAQGQVMRFNLSMAEIKRQWPSETDGDTQGAAEDARYWMDGGDVLSPCQMWAGVAANTPEKQAILKRLERDTANIADLGHLVR